MQIKLSAELIDCLEESSDGTQAFNMLTYSKLYTDNTYILSKAELGKILNELFDIHQSMRD